MTKSKKTKSNSKSLRKIGGKQAEQLSPTVPGKLQTWIKQKVVDNDETGSYHDKICEWENFSIEPIPNKGFGVKSKINSKVTDQVIEIPYGGVSIDRDEVVKMFKQGGDAAREKRTYLVEAADDEVSAWLDAHPRKLDINYPQNAWIGAFMNEPDDDKEPNFQLVSSVEGKPSKAMKRSYKGIQEKPFVWCEQIRDIAVGDECTVDYGWKDVIKERLGMKVKRRTTRYEPERQYTRKEKRRISEVMFDDTLKKFTYKYDLSYCI